MAILIRRDTYASSSSSSSYSSLSQSYFDRKMNRIKRYRDNTSEWAWKWRCRVMPKKEEQGRNIEDIDSLSDGDPKKAPTKDPALGIQPKIKTFFEGRHSDPMSSHFDWQDYPPKQVSASTQKNISGFAIKVYKIKDREKTPINGRFPLKHHMIEVQNPALVEAIEPILKKEDVFLDVNETATFNAPFRALYFGWSEILELYKNTDADTPLKGYLELLVRVLDDMFSELRVKMRHLRAAKLINFKHAWAYFPKNTTVYSFGKNSELLCRVKSTAYVKEGLAISGKMLAFNGEEFVWQNTTLTIPPFQGNKPITDLMYYPLQFHSDPEGLKEKLKERGKRVLDLQGLCYRTYSGIALVNGSNDEIQKHNVDSRILIDVVGFNKYHLAQGKRESKDPETVRNAATRRPKSSAARRSAEKDSSAKNLDKPANRRLSDEDQRKNKDAMLEKEDELVFMSPLIEGYALKNKMWSMFYVEDIMDMVWNDKAYDHLVYDEQQKDLVLSFVEHHGKKQDSLDDVILGKGQGLIMLLSGPPGTGKTLTAEAVADKTHRPLFYLQAEDLGINAATLGANIKRVFEMATDWDAVILLDEADVFMAERHPNDIARNELVSIFLRELEYFRGIIFLTTNLYHTIDSAFRSRVSLHLLFKPLGAEARELVWGKFLDRLPKYTTKGKAAITQAEDSGQNGSDTDTAVSEEDRGISDEDIKELGLWKLNGREIKNAVKMVQSWCDYKGYAISLSRLENGIKVTSPHSSKEGEADHSLYD